MFYFNLCITVIKRVRDIKVIQVYGQSQVGPQGLILDRILQFKGNAAVNDVSWFDSE